MIEAAAVNPPDGPGNCNVVARLNPELAGMTQEALNREVQSLPDDAASWAGYAGLQVGQVVLIDKRRGRIPMLDVPALIATMETSLENLEGRFSRKQMVAMTLTPGFIWSVNCGASSSRPMRLGGDSLNCSHYSTRCSGRSRFSSDSADQ